MKEAPGGRQMVGGVTGLSWRHRSVLGCIVRVGVKDDTSAVYLCVVYT